MDLKDAPLSAGTGGPTKQQEELIEAVAHSGRYRNAGVPERAL